MYDLDEKEHKGFEGKKVGLALSGGGFRASFFHLGVLARLAELDLLRNIKVISTVSGGSIIGALYYLKIREQRPVSREDYIEVIKSLEEHFVRGVKHNIRGKVFLNLKYEYRAVLKYREVLLSYFYRKYFYENRIMMSDLGDPELPKLIINTTNLEDGSHWYFSTTDFGQYHDNSLLPTSVGSIPYSDSNDTSICKVVAASSCVPGIFNYVKQKMTINNEKRVLRLVDGGAFDNTGIFALDKEQCDLLVVSDGSKQFNTDDLIPRNRFSILKRSYDLSLNINKKLLFERISGRVEHLHLQETHLNVNNEVGTLLSKIRTDLNKFTDFEWKSLSNFGYILTDKLRSNSYYGGSGHQMGQFSFRDSNIIALMSNSNNKNFPYYKSELISGADLDRVGGFSIFSFFRTRNIKHFLRGIAEILTFSRYIWYFYILIFVVGLIFVQLANANLIDLDNFKTMVIVKSIIYSCSFTFIIGMFYMFSKFKTPELSFLILKFVHLLILFIVYLLLIIGPMLLVFPEFTFDFLKLILFL